MKSNSCTSDKTIKYITRYLGHPVIASSRIDDYDGDFVTFHYKRHGEVPLDSFVMPFFISILSYTIFLI
ncbi:MAG: transposase [Firmicutes bacterium]|uniref:Transposase n=1 Tax=Candidatus Scybalomonas excrementavium TaxID=2840943 RepID=A0A9D9N8I8_9FIRM|nr:transposase [Candidatus Scybalomonas excrementavium]